MDSIKRIARMGYLRNLIPLLQQEITGDQLVLSESPYPEKRNQAQHELTYKVPNLKARIDELNRLEMVR